MMVGVNVCVSPMLKVRAVLVTFAPKFGSVVPTNTSDGRTWANGDVPYRDVMMSLPPRNVSSTRRPHEKVSVPFGAALLWDTKASVVFASGPVGAPTALKRACEVGSVIAAACAGVRTDAMLELPAPRTLFPS